MVRRLSGGAAGTSLEISVSDDQHDHKQATEEGIEPGEQVCPEDLDHRSAGFGLDRVDLNPMLTDGNLGLAEAGRQGKNVKALDRSAHGYSGSEPLGDRPSRGLDAWLTSILAESVAMPFNHGWAGCAVTAVVRSDLLAG